MRNKFFSKITIVQTIDFIYNCHCLRTNVCRKDCEAMSKTEKLINRIENLTDEQFIEIKKRKGVCGINFYPPFLCGGNADINTVIRHIEHFMSLGGKDSIGLGGDFDGIGITPHELENSSHIYRLLDKLLSLNYSEEIVEKIAYKNFINLFKRF